MLGLLGGAYVVVRSSVQTTTAQLWKEQAQAFEARLDECQSEAAENKAHKAAMKAAIEGLNHEVDTLRSVASAAPAIEALRRDVAIMHAEELGMLGQLVGLLSAKPPERRGGGGRTS